VARRFLANPHSWNYMVYPPSISFSYSFNDKPELRNDKSFTRSDHYETGPNQVRPSPGSKQLHRRGFQPIRSCHRMVDRQYEKYPPRLSVWYASIDLTLSAKLQSFLYLFPLAYFTN
jgi:hypothetical protein